MVEAHGDIIVKLPNNCNLLSESKIGPEIYASFDERIFAIQGHPEYSKEFMMKMEA